MTVSELLYFAELALLAADPQTTTTWAAIHLIRRASLQVAVYERTPRRMPSPLESL